MTPLPRTPGLAWSMALAFFALILAVSSIPAEAMPQTPGLWRWDKLVHGLEYAVAASLLFRAMHLGPPAIAKIPMPLRCLICLIVCSCFGVFDELYQGTVPGRNSSPFDMLADMAGASFASIGNAVFYSRPETASET